MPGRSAGLRRRERAAHRASQGRRCAGLGSPGAGKDGASYRAGYARAPSPGCSTSRSSRTPGPGHAAAILEPGVDLWDRASHRAGQVHRYARLSTRLRRSRPRRGSLPRPRAREPRAIPASAPWRASARPTPAKTAHRAERCSLGPRGPTARLPDRAACSGRATRPAHRGPDLGAGRAPCRA